MQATPFTSYFLQAQLFFYVLALLGMIMEKRQIRIKVLFIPYYFCVMNYAVLMGIIRYFTKKQSAVWGKSETEISVLTVADYCNLSIWILHHS